ncbi:MAG: hypothetical protein RBG13Loki_1710 [Promethearchaeota archaeon CR_4]|nr:MAG: hypothetical protein RBG13Loki_1710 [Candidatus Lokiarchaeota archaeon CR_4]
MSLAYCMSGKKPLTQPPQEEEEKPIPVFQLNDQEGEFEELEIDQNVPFYQLLDPHFCILFVDEPRFRVWLWQGRECSIRSKFISAKKAPSVRDKYGPALRITNVDDGDEPLAFKVLVGLAQPVELATQKQEGPSYTGTAVDDELLQDISLEKITVVLEKIGVPEGFRLEMVIVGRQIYGYQVQKKMYLGSLIEEKKLYPLREQVPDGTYLAEGYVPRLLFSYNNIVLIELLRPIENPPEASKVSEPQTAPPEKTQA